MTGYSDPNSVAYHDDDITAVACIICIIASVFMAIGMFVGWLIWAPPLFSYPDACEGLRVECAAVVEAGQ